MAMTQMGKHYGLPVYINVGLTDTKRPDAQAGLEAGITLPGRAAGADIFGHMGICGVDQGGVAVDAGAAARDHQLRRADARGMEVSDEALGLEVIREVGPGGQLHAQPHTVQHFRKELWFPQLLDRHYWSTWLERAAATCMNTPSPRRMRCSRSIRRSRSTRPSATSWIGLWLRQEKTFSTEFRELQIAWNAKPAKCDVRGAYDFVFFVLRGLRAASRLRGPSSLILPFPQGFNAATLPGASTRVRQHVPICVTPLPVGI